MEEEKKVETNEEDEKVVVPEKAEEQSSEKVETKEEFVKDTDMVSANKLNQAVRKLREAELEKRELEKKLAEKEASKVEVEPKKEVEEEVFVDEKEDETPKVDPSKLIDEKLKPVMDTLAKREAQDRKIQRTAFFEAHPEYLNDAEAWQGLLDEMDNSLNPNSKDDYYTQLEKAHRIVSGDTVNHEVEDKKKEMANDAASSASGAEKASVTEEFTAEDRKYQKQWGISDEGMRAYKEKLKSGSLRILS